MLRPRERTTLFGIFCAFTLTCLVIEIYLCYSMIANGFSGGKAVTGVFNGTITFLCGKLFLKVMSQALLQPDDVISFSKLHRFASDRCRVLEQDARSNPDQFSARQHLVTEVLRFAEQSLHGWLSGTHFELCIFVDQEQPLLFAYFDSNGATTARSMKERESNPSWYIENDYEVVKVLAKASSHPHIIQNTGRKGSDYFFASEQQRTQLKSTMLWCIDVSSPSAIVISSDATNAFRKTDPEVIAFIKFIGNLVRFDLTDGQFLSQMKKLRPDLFPLAAK